MIPIKISLLLCIVVGYFGSILTSSSVYIPTTSTEETGNNFENNITSTEDVLEYLNYLQELYNLHVRWQLAMAELKRIEEMSKYCTNIYEYVRYASVIGIAGNILVLAVIVKYQYLQSTANVYVFSISVADTILLTTRLLPLGFYRYIYVYYLAQCLNSTIVWIILGLTVNLYMVLCHPTTSKKYCTPTKAIILNIFLWVMVALYVYGWIFSETFSSPWKEIVSPICSNLLIKFFLMPLCIEIVLFILIGYKLIMLIRSRLSFQSERSGTGRNIRISVSLVVRFITCYGPVTVYDLLHKYVYTGQTYNMVFSQYMLDFLFLFYQVVNPMIYAIVSQCFRKAYKDILHLEYVINRCCRKNTVEPESVDLETHNHCHIQSEQCTLFDG